MFLVSSVCCDCIYDARSDCIQVRLCPRENERVHAGGASSDQGSGRSAQGGSGGEHVVHEHDPSPADRVPPRTGRHERVPDVSPAFLGVQPDLTPPVAPSFQGPAKEMAGPGRDLPGEELGLVVSAPHPTSGRGGDRDQHRAGKKDPTPTFSNHYPPHFPRETVPAVVLEAADHHRPGAPVDDGGSDRSQRGVPIPALEAGAHEDPPGSEGEPAPLAAGGGGRNQTGQAGAADDQAPGTRRGRRNGDSGPAAQAGGRKQEVQDGAQDLPARQRSRILSRVSRMASAGPGSPHQSS